MIHAPHNSKHLALTAVLDSGPKSPGALLQREEQAHQRTEAGHPLATGCCFEGVPYEPLLGWFRDANLSLFRVCGLDL